jgi:O-antigen/teichoic acid export membrane protein
VSEATVIAPPSSLRGVIKDVAIYSAGDLLLRASAFITLPIYTRVLTPSDYGVWAYVTSGVTLLSAVLALGGDQTYSRFYFEASTLEGKRLLTSTWLGFLAVWSTGVVLLIVPASGLASQRAFGTTHWSLLIALILLTGPVTLLNILLGLVVRNEFKPKLFMALNVLLTLLTIGLSLLFAVGFGWGITGLAAGQLTSMCLLIPPRVWYARDLLKPVFSTRLLRKLLRFALPLVPGTVAWWIFGFSDRIVLGRLSTLHEVGLYSVANSATTVLGLFVGAVGLGWAPHALRMYEERRNEAPAFYGRMLTYLIVGFGALSILVTTFAHELLSILVGHAFLGAAEAVGPLALGFVAFATIQVTGNGMMLMKKTGYLAAVAWGAALLNLALNIAFVPAYGMMASAWATFASFASLTIGYFVISQRLFPVIVQHHKVVLGTLITIGFTTCVPLLPHLPVLAAIAVKLVYVLVAAGAFVATGVVERRELAVAWSAAERFIPGRSRGGA